MLRDKSLIEDFDLVEKLEDKATEVISGGMLVYDSESRRLAGREIATTFNFMACLPRNERHVGGSCYCVDTWICIKEMGQYQYQLQLVGGDPDCGMYELPNICDNNE